MKAKLIIVSQAPLTPQIRRNTYVEEYIRMGYDTQFWDLSQIIHPGIKICDEEYNNFLSYIHDLSELEDMIVQSNYTNSIFIFDFDPAWKTHNIFKLFYKYNCYCIRIDMYANTSLKRHKNTSIALKIRKVFSSTGLNVLKWKFKTLSYKLYSSYFCPFHFKKILSSSRFSVRTDYINHPDYDLYKRNEEKTDIKTPYILFVDTYFGCHPYLKYYHNIKSKINVDAYYKSLNSYFDFIEDKYSMPVIIAAHPKAQYDINVFGNRQIIKYQTMPLIKQAEYVVAQVCNTFSWIVLADKPVALIATDEYMKLYNLKRGIQLLSETLNIKIHNIDKCRYDDVCFEKINNKDRLSYIYGYLTCKETENKFNRDILNELFSNIVFQ